LLREVFQHPSLKRAKDAIAKRRLWQPRVVRFVQLPMIQGIVESIVMWTELRVMAMLFLASYIFMLRVPSEALPMAAHGAGGKRCVPIFRLHGDMVELWHPKRKNRLHPSSSYRPCWCKKCPITCPVHILGAFMAELPVGTQPFVRISPAQANSGLKRMLQALDVPHAEEFITHDMRRGHAEDLRRGGATLGEILRAGDWKSPAFLHYLDAEQLDMDRIVEAHDLGSSDDEVGEGPRSDCRE
jgi:hypothetical protein